MNKSQIKRELSQFAKDTGMISPTRLQKFLSFGYNETMDLLSGLEYIQTSKGRKYFISDVSEKIIERLQV